MITTAAIGAAVVAAVGWAGKAFVTWIVKRQERLAKRDALEHQQKRGKQ